MRYAFLLLLVLMATPTLAKTLSDGQPPLLGGTSLASSIPFMGNLCSDLTDFQFLLFVIALILWASGTAQGPTPYGLVLAISGIVLMYFFIKNMCDNETLTILWLAFIAITVIRDMRG